MTNEEEKEGMRQLALQEVWSAFQSLRPEGDSALWDTAIQMAEYKRGLLIKAEMFNESRYMYAYILAAAAYYIDLVSYPHDGYYVEHIPHQG